MTAVVSQSPSASGSNLSAADSAAASIHEARALVGDLFTARPWIYWSDLAVTLGVGYSAASAYLNAPLFSLLQGISFVVCGFALFRAGTFIHEIAHFRQGEMRSFRIGWNLVCGIPLVMPSHFYENHIDHHNSHQYGTRRDGEYVRLGTGPLYEILLFVLQAPFLPAYVALRLLLAPFTFVHPRVRNFVLARMSSYVMNFHHRLTIPKNAPRRAWAALEIACCLRLAVMFLIVLLGVYPSVRLVQIYLLAVFSMSLNYLRNLVAHRYENKGGQMTHAEQLADSINITGTPLLTELFFPLGLRYHALHHLFPSIPYHNLAKAHRRLMEKLPADSPYRQTVFSSYGAAFRALLTTPARAKVPADGALAA
jgi:fatty acid desaturase